MNPKKEAIGFAPRTMDSVGDAALFSQNTEETGKGVQSGDGRIPLLTGKDVAAQLPVKFVIHLEEQRELWRQSQSFRLSDNRLRHHSPT